MASNTCSEIGEDESVLLNTQHCRMSFFDRGSKQLVITFNSMGQSLEDDFGRDFFRQLEISQISIACSSKDFFQSLSLEDFLEIVAEPLKSHTDIVSYGTSLGGYAAIYYGSALKARILAIAPRFPIHSYMKGIRSYHADIKIQHQDLRQSSGNRSQLLTVYDPQEEADAKFVSHFLDGRENTKLIELNGAGHYILKQLKVLDLLGVCIEGFMRSNDFQAHLIKQTAFTQSWRDKAQSALNEGDLEAAKLDIQYLTKIRTGHDPFMTPWGLIKQYVELCEVVDITLPHILSTEHATLSRRLGQPNSPRKMMEALIKHNYLTCQYQACLSLAELAHTRYPDSVIAHDYIVKATATIAKIKLN